MILSLLYCAVFAVVYLYALYCSNFAWFDESLIKYLFCWYLCLCNASGLLRFIMMHPFTYFSLQLLIIILILCIYIQLFDTKFQIFIFSLNNFSNLFVSLNDVGILNHKFVYKLLLSIEISFSIYLICN